MLLLSSYSKIRSEIGSFGSNKHTKELETDVQSSFQGLTICFRRIRAHRSPSFLSKFTSLIYSINMFLPSDVCLPEKSAWKIPETRVALHPTN